MGSPDNDLIFKEVDEDLQRDRMNALWKKYGSIASGVALLIVGGIAGNEAWKAYDASQRTALGAQYEAASRLAEGDNADPAAASTAFAALAQEASGGYAMLASMRRAGLLTEAGEIDQAVAIYNGVAADTGLEERYRDLAAILAVTAQGEGIAATAALSALEPVAAKTGPWRYFARELVAVYANQAGQTDKARSEFTALADDPSAPAGVRARAAEFLQTIAE